MRRQLLTHTVDDKGKGSVAAPTCSEARALSRQTLCTEAVAFSRQWQSDMIPPRHREAGYDASFHAPGGTRLDISKVKWLQPRYGSMHRQIFEPYLEDIRSLCKGHQERDANTSKCRIRIIINGDQQDRAYITIHNVFSTLMIIGRQVNAYFAMIHANYDTDDRMPASPIW